MYVTSSSKWLKHGDFLILDLVFLQVAFMFAYYLRNNQLIPYEVELYREVAFVITGASIATGYLGESYEEILRRGYWKEFKLLTKHVVIVTAVVAGYLILIKKTAEFSRAVLILYPIISILLLYPVRLGYKHIIRKRASNSFASKRLALVASIENYDKMIDVFLDDKFSIYQVKGAGVINNDVNMVPDEYRGVKLYSRQEDFEIMIQSNWVDEVLISLPRGMEAPEKFITHCRLMGITLHEKIARLDLLEGNNTIENIQGYTVLTHNIGGASAKAVFTKRAMDIVGGIVGVIITGILAIIVGPIIKSKSPGPIFFKQTRVGRNGKLFEMYKFRSMYMDAEERKQELMAQNNIKDGFMFKMDNDPRIIKGIGNFIRKTSIDEFPQFWNVLKGDMSLVGTRPPLPQEVEQYDWHHYSRLAVKPGITGLWQVSGRSDITDFEEVVRLDLQYIANWSLGQDIKILLQTVKVVFKREGSK